MDAANFGRCQKYDFGAFLLKKLLSGDSIFQVQFGMRTPY